MHDVKPYWVGWLYGNPEDREFFKSLGVRGPMVYKVSDNSQSATVEAHEKAGVFEHCWASDETLQRLKEQWPAFYDSFSWVEADNNYWELRIARQ